jgi:hypothetical protein
MSEEIELGWYVPASKKRRFRPRWVLGMGNGSVIYGTGDRLHHECKVKTFLGWIRRTQATHKSKEDAPEALFSPLNEASPPRDPKPLAAGS